jgi:predicted metal-dependent hydrolase
MSVDIRNGVFILDGREVSYRLERRKGRRSVSIYVDPRDGLLLRTHPRFPLREVEEVLRGEEDWIRDKLRWQEDWLQNHPERHFVSGEDLPLLGENWTLELRKDASRRRARVLAENGRILLELPMGGNARHVMDNWMRRLARRLVLARVEHWSSRIGRSPRRVTLRDMSSRWGSCSSTGNLSFNWKLVMAPPEILDYIVVHELCHFVHPNHSKDFWDLVESYLPDYEAPRRWLRRKGATLYF